MNHRPAIEAFDAECAALVAVVRTLSSDELERPTNCPPWTLHELVVHIAASIRIPGRAIPTAPDSLPPGSAADYDRRPERDTAGYRTGNVERTHQLAATVPPEAVTALLTVAWRRTSNTVTAHDPDQRMEAGGRAPAVEIPIC